MRPVTRLLRDELRDRIIAEAREVLCKLGVEIHNEPVLSMLADHGAKVDEEHLLRPPHRRHHRQSACYRPPLLQTL